MDTSSIEDWHDMHDWLVLRGIDRDEAAQFADVFVGVENNNVEVPEATTRLRDKKREACQAMRDKKREMRQVRKVELQRAAEKDRLRLRCWWTWPLGHTYIRSASGLTRTCAVCDYQPASGGYSPY